jgi:hypothetical protein
MKIILAVLLLCVATTLAGCNRGVIMVPECEYGQPPDPVAYLKGNPDENLVLMSAAYNDGLRKASTCNANITKINAKNKALFE